MRLHQAMQVQLKAKKWMLAYNFLLSAGLIGRMPDTERQHSEREVCMA